MGRHVRRPCFKERNILQTGYPANAVALDDNHIFIRPRLFILGKQAKRKQETVQLFGYITALFSRTGCKVSKKKSEWPNIFLLEVSPPWRRHYCRLGRLAWCNDPESYAGGSVATGRATLAGQVKGEHPDKERYYGPPGWELGVLLATAPRKKIHCCEGSTRKFCLNRPRPTQGCRVNRIRRRRPNILRHTRSSTWHIKIHWVVS